MRITLLTNRDLASNIALNLLLPALSDRHQLEVFCSSSVGTPSAHPDMATLQFLEQTLPNDLLFPMIDAQAREGELLTFQGLEHYLKSPIRSLNAPNSPEGLKFIRATAPRPDGFHSIWTHIAHRGTLDTRLGRSKSALRAVTDVSRRHGNLQSNARPGRGLVLYPALDRG